MERTPDLGFFRKAIVGGAAVSGIAAAAIVTESMAMKGGPTGRRRRRGDGGYHPMVGNWQSPPVEVDASQFVAQADAARRLGISAFRIGGLVGEGRLTPVLRNGEAGVSTESLATEVDLRRRQPVRARLRSVFHWLSF